MKTIASNASNNSKRGDTKLFLIGMPFSKRSTLIVNKKKIKHNDHFSFRKYLNQFVNSITNYVLSLYLFLR